MDSVFMDISAIKLVWHKLAWLVITPKQFVGVLLIIICWLFVWLGVNRLAKKVGVRSIGHITRFSRWVNGFVNVWILHPAS